MAYDIIHGTNKYRDKYSKLDLEEFNAYIDGQLKLVENTLDLTELRKILLDIYSNPVVSRENLD